MMYIFEYCCIPVWFLVTNEAIKCVYTGPIFSDQLAKFCSHYDHKYTSSRYYRGIVFVCIFDTIS